MKRLSVLAAALALSACAQDYGVTHVTATFDPTGNITAFDWATGTEKANVDVTANVRTGEVHYMASDVKAFDGQKIAGDIYAGLAAAGVKVSESIVRGVVTGVLGTAAIQGAGAAVGGIIESNAALEAAKLKAGK